MESLAKQLSWHVSLGKKPWWHHLAKTFQCKLGTSHDGAIWLKHFNVSHWLNPWWSHLAKTLQCKSLGNSHDGVTWLKYFNAGRPLGKSHDGVNWLEPYAMQKLSGQNQCCLVISLYPDMNMNITWIYIYPCPISSLILLSVIICIQRLTSQVLTNRSLWISECCYMISRFIFRP
jgi:hypothetical protein